MSGRSEFAWIDRFATILGGAATPRSGRGIGDDAALVEGPEGSLWAWTVDGLVEERHFRFEWFEPEEVGRRALVASLSDLAATGAEPAGALVSMAGPAGAFERVAEGIYRGLAEAARDAGCPILGGDLARAGGPLHLVVTALGPVVAGPPWTRAGARPGDRVWVTGRLGAPAAAIALHEAAGEDAGRLRAAGAHPSRQRLVDVAARVREARWLRERAGITAAIDVSDGVSGDVRHVADRSGVRVVLEAEAIPVHPAARSAAGELAEDPLRWALDGGEEWELLLTAPEGELEPLADAFVGEFAVELTPIGEVAEGAGVGLRRDGSERPLEAGGWDHFADTNHAEQE